MAEWPRRYWPGTLAPAMLRQVRKSRGEWLRTEPNRDEVMNKNDTEGPKRNITWQMQPLRAPCEHQYEIIAHQDANELRRCTKCGDLEAEAE
jgi:hypothetical protein